MRFLFSVAQLATASRACCCVVLRAFSGGGNGGYKVVEKHGRGLWGNDDEGVEEECVCACVCLC